MAEFIGSRISLISKRDIRYVGTLHEISSENSTVALEQVVSFGTEGRRPDDEVLPSDNVYEYIVFRGSDVKDLRIEETPKEVKPLKHQVPDDPAILGSVRRPTPLAAPQAPAQQQQQVQETQPKQSEQVSQPQQPQQVQKSQPPQQPQQAQQVQQLQTHHFNQHQQHAPRFQPQPYPYYFAPPPNQRFGPQGFPNYPGMPLGAPQFPPYLPSGQAFHQPPLNQYYPQPQPGSVAQQQSSHGLPVSSAPAPQQAVAAAPVAKKEQKLTQEQEIPEKPIATVKLPSASTTPGPVTVAARGPPPTPVTESKPDIAAGLAPPAPPETKENLAISKPVPTGPKNGRIMPVIPRLSPAPKPSVPVNGSVQPTPGKLAIENANAAANSDTVHPSPAPAAPSKSPEEMNREARAAVAAAMAKLPPGPGKKKGVNGDTEVENSANRVTDQRPNDNHRTSRQRGTAGVGSSHRGARGGYRGGRSQAEHHVKKVEVPATDYDFVSANAKFNKQDLVKEAIATGSPVGGVKDAGNTGDPQAEASVNGARTRSESNLIVPITPSYNKTSSFFDNISSESKDRDEANAKRTGGREFRNEEQKKNLETFGQGSVDNGYRLGFRGRGNGRGRGYGRPRGGYGRGGRGAMRGGQGSGAVRAES